MTKSLRAELLIVLTLTFGISGVRAVLNLINSLAAPQRLDEQSVTLNSSQSSLAWVDMGLQLCSAAVLFSYGALALFLLAKDRIMPRAHRARDWLEGAGLAALIGIPGLALYFAALQLGWSKEVIPGDFANAWVEIPVSLLKAAANAFAEETVVVMWLMTRLRQAHWSLPATLAASSILRGSYHLYQGVSAGCGNIIMGLIYGYYYHRTGRVWPLVIAHFLIDAVAFVGYSFL
ncbi:CPBP family intramembrane glutamic endopeptidase [Corynebacterium tuberculostearicum]|uniref:CPBP family intramembrane glutamic endopeptidase n=1 Tax=Corynebacterium tuberculostearicum TaxID=38304 RepID=UPI0025DCD862|nr:CPBP family intramembrane glutamic endopeptidase [Corynebacterium tuberculostearicum]MDV2433089.1 CPBP family intramembrane metalloprotease [Corynebacterium tuberculostearicum]WKE60626.1 CPBP family intramembrane metalloprotease [Corynebacterium tuberculostearicum]